MTDKFTWSGPNGETITLPFMRDISAGLLRRNRNADEMGILFAVIEDASDESMLAKIDALKLGELEALVTAWVDEVGPGESSGSSTS